MSALIRKLAKHGPNCREVMRLSAEGLDRTLSWPERFWLKVHLSLCVLCERYRRQLAFIQRAVGRYAAQVEEITTSQPPMPDEAKQRVARWIGDRLGEQR